MVHNSRNQVGTQLQATVLLEEDSSYLLCNNMDMLLLKAISSRSRMTLLRMDRVEQVLHQTQGTECRFMATENMRGEEVVS